MLKLKYINKENLKNIKDDYKLSSGLIDEIIDLRIKKIYKEVESCNDKISKYSKKYEKATSLENKSKIMSKLCISHTSLNKCINIEEKRIDKLNLLDGYEELMFYRQDELKDKQSIKYLCMSLIPEVCIHAELKRINYSEKLGLNIDYEFKKYNESINNKQKTM